MKTKDYLVKFSGILHDGTVDNCRNIVEMYSYLKKKVKISGTQEPLSLKLIEEEKELPCNNFYICNTRNGEIFIIPKNIFEAVYDKSWGDGLYE